MLSLPITFLSVIGVFAPIFSRPLWPQVQVLLTGAVLAPGKRTVTAVLQIMGRSAAPDFQTYHRVLNRAVWSPLTTSRLLFRLLVAVFIFRGVFILGLDDPLSADAGSRSLPQASPATLCAPRTRIWSKPVACAACVYAADPLAWADRVWALPFLTVLCPSERFYAQRGRPQTLTERAWQMIRLVGRWVPGRAIV
jgi:hypothetical protein